MGRVGSRRCTTADRLCTSTGPQPQSSEKCVGFLYKPQWGSKDSSLPIPGIVEVGTVAPADLIALSLCSYHTYYTLSSTYGNFRFV